MSPDDFLSQLAAEKRRHHTAIEKIERNYRRTIVLIVLVTITALCL